MTSAIAAGRTRRAGDVAAAPETPGVLAALRTLTARPFRAACVAAMLMLPAYAAPVAAQALEGAGTVPTGLLLRRLDGVKRVLMIGAHPDDEDTGFLAVMARGLGAKTAYLSLTRGDGGQNLIGPELWEGLGVIRTGELEAARALDGGWQLFTRAFDFGFSKSAEEALTLWPRDELLADVVLAIRRFRPHVVVSVFSGTPRDGHGQHQAAGIVAREAFRVAGDPEAFPGQLTVDIRPWSPAKLFRTARRRIEPNTAPEEGEIVVPTGDFDPLLGRSAFQLAMESRSQHRSQDMGTARTPGPQATSVVLVDTRVPEAGPGIFAGIDTTLAGLADGLPEDRAASVRRHLDAYRAAIADAGAGLGADPSGIVPDLLRATAHLDLAVEAIGEVGGPEGASELEARRSLLAEAVMAASGIVFDVRAADDIVVPGQSVAVEALLWNGGPWALVAPTVELRSRYGWEVRAVETEGLDDGRVPAGALATWRFEVRLPPDAELSRLYYLEEGRDGAMYRWPEDPALRGLPRDPADVVGLVTLALATEGAAGSGRAGTSGPGLTHEVPWRFVGVDQAIGEYAEPVLVLPALSAAVSPSGMAWPDGRTSSREVTVVVRAEAEEGARGRVRLEAPSGWVVEPEARTFELAAAGAERSLAFRVGPSGTARPGEVVLRTVVEADDGTTYREGFTLIDYPHIERAARFEPAEADITVLPVRVREGLRVGYIMGTGDDGPDALRQMGAHVELLGEARVRDGAFDGYDVLVLGVRAYEARPDVRAANAQILEFARAGGTVVNQYNQYQFSDGDYAPAPLTIGRPAPRVSIETQPVRVLEPDAPIFSTPNRITGEDFEGWVQERGLYFASEWDGSYLPLLEMNDPGEPPRRGSLLVTSVGEGVYVYTGLSFFRQWSERVPGAYRLFANLVSLDGAAWRAFLEGR